MNPVSNDVVDVFCRNLRFEAVPQDEGLLLSRRDGDQVVTLNATAATVFGLIDGRRSTAQIRELLQDAYPESAAEVARDVDGTLADLLEEKVIRRVEIAQGILPLAEYGLTFGINPKCACSFVKKWWCFLAGHEVEDTGRASDYSAPVHEHLANLQDTRRDLFVDDPAHFHVAFIRNPVERIRSAYADKVGNPHNAMFYREGLAFDDWIRSLLADWDRRYHWDWHWTPQVMGLQGRRWDRFVDIGAGLEPAVRSIERRFDLPAFTYEHVRYKRRPKPAVSETTLAMILELYAPDFELFDEACPEISERWIHQPVAEEDYVFAEPAAS